MLLNTNFFGLLDGNFILSLFHFLFHFTCFVHSMYMCGWVCACMCVCVYQATCSVHCVPLEDAIEQW